MALLTLVVAGLALWLPGTQLPGGNNNQVAPAMKVSSVVAQPGSVGQNLFISGSVVPGKKSPLAPRCKNSASRLSWWKRETR